MSRLCNVLLVRTAMLSAALLLSAGCAKETPSNTSDGIDSNSNSNSNVQPVAGGSNVRAHIDPVTGQLREPTAEELAAEAAEAAKKKPVSDALNKPTEQKEVRLPNGAVAIELGDSAQQPLKACIAKNGDVKMEHECPPDVKPHQ